MRLSVLKGREKGEVICIDHYSFYRQLIGKWFPSATTVANRFHVVRIARYHFLRLCRALVKLNTLRKDLVIQ